MKIWLAHQKSLVLFMIYCRETPKEPSGFAASDGYTLTPVLYILGLLVQARLLQLI